jgi:hypothetical protein
LLVLISVSIEIEVERAPNANGSDFNAYSFTDVHKGPVFKVYDKRNQPTARFITYFTVNGGNENNLVRKVREKLLEQDVRDGQFKLTIVTRSLFPLSRPTSAEPWEL